MLSDYQPYHRILPYAVIFSDLKTGEILDCNSTTLEIYDSAEKGDLIGKNVSEMIAPKDKKIAIEKILSQETMKNMEYTFLTKNSNEFPAEISTKVVRDPSGRPTSFVITARNIAKRKQLDQMKNEFICRLRRSGLF